jgi:CRP-like cAMP-binding protein
MACIGRAAMPKPNRNTPGNRLLAALPPEEAEALRPHLEQVPLVFREDLYDKNRPIEHVYFVNSGVVSMVAPMKEGMPVEIATVGPEGMVGVPVFLGAKKMPSRAFVQVPGEAVRIGSDAFRSVIATCPVLNRLLLRYTLALMNQMAQSAACNRAHSIEERCARWLLMTQDRVNSRTFPLTQEFLAQMLGVRRPTVSVAAGMLANAGLISYVRGQITILDHAGLERAACECYRVIADEFARMGVDEAAPQRFGRDDGRE